MERLAEPKYRVEHNNETKAMRDTSRPWLVIRSRNGRDTNVHGRYTTKAGAQRAMNRVQGGHA